jgi:hypothetical protein
MMFKKFRRKLSAIHSVRVEKIFKLTDKLPLLWSIAPHKSIAEFLRSESLV